MEPTAEDLKYKGSAPYYEELGRACDFIMRCVECKKLAVNTDIATSKGCPHCGNKRFNEVRSLSTWEWFKIWTGIIDFPHRKKFLQEFSSRG